MAKTRSQTGDPTTKKEEEERDRMCTLGLGNGTTRTTRNKIAKRKSPKKKRFFSDSEDDMEKDSDTEVLLKSESKCSKAGKNKWITQEKIDQLIDYIVNQNMSIPKAARELNISDSSGAYYYQIYHNDPKKRIPLPVNRRLANKRCFTHEDIENLIRYIDIDKMPVARASEKANMSYESGRYYYARHLKNPGNTILTSHLGQSLTHNQNEESTGKFIDNKKTLMADSKMGDGAGYGRDDKHINKKNRGIPAPSHTARTCYRQERSKELIGYIMDDKLTLFAASKKANMSWATANSYYQKYLKEHNLGIPTPKSIQPQIDEFIGYTIHDKMPIMEAAKKANICVQTARKYHRQYLEDHNLPVPVPKIITQDQIDQLIGYIVRDKMTILAASKKANMSSNAGGRYYRKYRENQKSDALTPCPQGNSSSPE